MREILPASRRSIPCARAAKMKNIRPIEMRFLDDLFGMGGGYVLDFSNATFAEFFDQEIGVNIDDPEYAAEGGSKGKRLRHFLQSADKPTVIRTLQSLWEYREDFRRRAGTPETMANAQDRLRALIDRLSQNTSSAEHPAQPENAVDVAKIAQLRAELLNLSSLDPQPRGFAFERFVNDHRLKPVASGYGLKPD